MFLFLLGRFLEVDLLGWMVNLCLTLQGTAKMLSIVAVPFHSHQNTWSFLFFHILVNTWYCLTFYCSHFSGCVVVCHFCFNTYFPNGKFYSPCAYQPFMDLLKCNVYQIFCSLFRSAVSPTFTVAFLWFQQNAWGIQWNDSTLVRTPVPPCIMVPPGAHPLQLSACQWLFSDGNHGVSLWARPV